MIYLQVFKAMERHYVDLYYRYVIYWRRKWQPTPLFLPEKSHEGKSQVVYNPWGGKGLDTTE